MAATQAQWFEKLKSWVPQWFFQSDSANTAVFMALAKVLEEAQLEMEDTVAETFLQTATSVWLDLHGSERVIERLPDETDEQYRVRIRLIQNTTSIETMTAIIKAAMNNDDPIMIENWNYGFADFELFADCEDSVYLSKTRQLNRFTVIIPVQTVLDDTTLKANIVAAIDDKKAMGVFADIIYRT